jgi:hypothetical protein
MRTARDAVQLADRLCRRVLAPLLQGGRVQPLSPIGSARALAAIQFDLPPPDDLAQLLGDLRIDTTVSWWVGSELFQGRRPPARLTAWPELRRVRRHQEQVRLVDMPPPDAPWRTTWLECMAKLYSASPLTDLSQVDRAQPAFRWTGGLCGFTRNPVGRRLALRAVGRTTDRPRAVATLLAAARYVESEAARAHADAFAAEVDSIR